MVVTNKIIRKPSKTLTVVVQWDMIQPEQKYGRSGHHNQTVQYKNWPFLDLLVICEVNPMVLSSEWCFAKQPYG